MTVPRPRDLQLARRAKKHGAKFSLRIVLEARRSENVPVSLAFALVEQETGFRNVFGHDGGSILHGQTVTRSRVQQLLRHIAAGGASNGVGPTQLTWPPFIRRAERLGGAHNTRHTIRVGVEILDDLIEAHGRTLGIRKYNGTGRAAERYAREVLDKMDDWHRRLT